MIMRLIFTFVICIYLAALVDNSKGQDDAELGEEDAKPDVVGFDYDDKDSEEGDKGEENAGGAAAELTTEEVDKFLDDLAVENDDSIYAVSDEKADSAEATAAVEKDVEEAQTVAVEGGEEKQDDDGAQAVADEAAAAVEPATTSPDSGAAPEGPDAWLQAHKAKRERLDKRIEAIKATRKDKKKQRNRCLRGGCHDSTDEQKECINSPGCSAGRTTCGADQRTYHTECHAKCYGTEKLHWGPCRNDKKKMHLPVGKPIELQKNELYPDLECHASLIRNNLFGHRFGQGYIVKVMAECNKPSKFWSRFPSQCYEKCVLQKHGILRPRGDGLLPEKAMLPKMFKDKEIRSKIAKRIVENCKPLLSKAKGATIQQRVQCGDRTEFYHCVDQAMSCEGLY